MNVIKISKDQSINLSHPSNTKNGLAWRRSTRRIPYGSLLNLLWLTWDWIGNSTSDMISVTSALQKSNLLIGNPAKAKQKLGWEPNVRFEETGPNHGGC
jgi:hypothetical protein